MSDAFSTFRLDWLDQVARDDTLPPSALRVAVILMRHLNRKSGLAWPSQGRLAEALGLTDRAVRKAIDALVKAGHLSVTAGRGRSKSSVYKPILHAVAAANDDDENRNERSSFEDGKPEQPFLFSDDENRNGSAVKAERQRTKSGTGVPTNLLKNTPTYSGRREEHSPVADAPLASAPKRHSRRKQILRLADLPEPVREWTDALFAAYPRRHGDNQKLPAAIIVQRLIDDGEDMQAIVDAASAYAAAWHGRDDRRFIPKTRTWLSEETFRLPAPEFAKPGRKDFTHANADYYAALGIGARHEPQSLEGYVDTIEVEYSVTDSAGPRRARGG